VIDAPTIIAWSSAAATPRQSVPARAIIRISGSLTRDLLARVLATPLPQCPSASIARIRLNPSELPCLLVFWHAPRSYTGEDAAELIIPGSEPLVRRVLTAFLTLDGVQLAGPGEFSARAHAASKLTLEEAEGVAAAIAAGTGEELAAARDLMDGHAGAAYHALADELATLAALVEAAIDFTDQEDVVAIPPADLVHRLDQADAALASRLGGSTEHRAARPLVALVGPPNAGKSTLFNALLGRTRSVASPTAGTTRDVVIEPLDLGPCTIDLADSAGLEDPANQPDARASTLIDAAARDRALDLARRAHIVVWCDPTGRFDDPSLRDAAARRAILVRTRADQWLPRDLSPQPQHVRTDILAVCALDGWHLSLLKDRLARQALGTGNSSALVIYRHRDVLLRVRAAIALARKQVDPAARTLAQSELVASHLHAALDAVGELTGRIERDEVIGRVFAQFCVGK
jgi:tRNA modification GTPase